MTLLDDPYFQKRMEEIDKARATHSWVYGTFDVRCALCHVSKASARGMRPCGLLSGGLPQQRCDCTPEKDYCDQQGTPCPWRLLASDPSIAEGAL